MRKSKSEGNAQERLDRLKAPNKKIDFVLDTGCLWETLFSIYFVGRKIMAIIMDATKVSSGKTRMIAYRGVSGLKCENTNAAFVAAENRSYFGIETDVHVTADGKFGEFTTMMRLEYQM